MTRFFSILIILFVSLFFLTPTSPLNATSLAERLSGQILLQVEQNGEAWYVYPEDEKRYYMGRPSDAFELMRSLGLGATHEFIVSYSIYPDHVLGKILLDVEKNGEAYYIYPNNKKAYYLGRPEDAFEIMRSLGLGITDANLNLISEVEGTSPSSTHVDSGGVDQSDVDEIEDDISSLDEVLDELSEAVGDLNDSGVGF